jgi:hypothetical protein
MDTTIKQYQKMKYLFIICVFFCFACDDIFDENIEDKHVEIISPVGGCSINEGSITFMWENMEGAEYYHLMIVSPSFIEMSNVICDTIIYGDSLKTVSKKTAILQSGNYQWFVKAFNSAYSSLNPIYELTVLDILKPEEDEPVQDKGDEIDQ